MATAFQTVYDSFFSKITDDMYLSLSDEDTSIELFSFLKSAITRFKYPRVDLRQYDEFSEEFTNDLDIDEIEVLAELMKLSWIKRQIETIEILKMKFSDRDFQLTSQANHLAKLLELRKVQQADVKTIQEEYGRVDKGVSLLAANLAGK